MTIIFTHHFFFQMVITDVALVSFQCFVGASDVKFSIGHPCTSSAVSNYQYSKYLKLQGDRQNIT
jgi:hypothetical protein